MASSLGFRRRSRINSQNFVRTRPVKRKFGLEYLDVSFSLHTLADGGSRVVDPCPTTHGEFRCRTQCVSEGGVSVVNARDGEGMVFANHIVRTLLLVSIRVGIG